MSLLKTINKCELWTEKKGGGRGLNIQVQRDKMRPRKTQVGKKMGKKKEKKNRKITDPLR